MYLFIKHFLTRSQSAYSNSTLIQFSVPQEIQFILEKGGEILDSVGAEACEVLPALILLGVPGLWVWQWDRSLFPPHLLTTCSSLGTLLPRTGETGQLCGEQWACPGPRLFTRQKMLVTSCEAQGATTSKPFSPCTSTVCRILEGSANHHEPLSVLILVYCVHWVPKQRRRIENRIDEWDDALICSQAEVEATVFRWMYASYFSTVWISFLT